MNRYDKIENLFTEMNEHLMKAHECGEEIEKELLAIKIERYMKDEAIKEDAPAEASPTKRDHTNFTFADSILPHEPKFLKAGENIVPEKFWKDPPAGGYGEPIQSVLSRTMEDIKMRKEALNG